MRDTEIVTETRRELRVNNESDNEYGGGDKYGYIYDDDENDAAIAGKQRYKISYIRLYSHSEV